MNLGLGVERLAMINYNYDDVRKMVYPQFYEQTLSDRDIAYSIKVDKIPVLDELKDLTNELIELCIKNKDKASPCDVSIEKKIKFYGTTKTIKITLFEKEEGKNLLGPSILNKIFVHNGNVLGIPETFENVKEDFVKLLSDAKEKGAPTNLTYIDTICYKITSKIEEALISNTKEFKIRTPIVRSLSDVNLKIDELALKQIMGNNKIIDIRGPVFLNVKVEIK
jgi:O-phosphoseryl-tRNA synthetase